MIIDVWKPRMKGRKILYYEIHEGKILHGYKIRYTCDFEYCRNKEKIYTTNIGTLIKGSMNSLDFQICRSCRSIISERKKGVIIPFSVIKQELEMEGYTVFTKEEEYMFGETQPSQFPIDVECKNGHRHFTTWNNWKNKRRRCRRCYDENRFFNALKYKNNFQKYKINVVLYTEKTYKKFKSLINPNGYKRTRSGYHLDHKFSITEGFNHKISPKIIGSACNLELITYDENIRKGSKCSITKEELLNEYIKQNKKF